MLCKALTVKGVGCKKEAVKDGLCTIHLKSIAKKAKVKTPKVKKAKTVKAKTPRAKKKFIIRLETGLGLERNGQSENL
jgi:hypothetical protein